MAADRYQQYHERTYEHIMSKTLQFLDSLTERELAYFAKFKSSKYSKETNAEIQTYLKQKNMTLQKISVLTNNKSFAPKNQTKICYRCGSNKLLVNNVPWTETHAKVGREDEIAAFDGFAGKLTYKDEIICNVCDNWLQDPNNQRPKKGFNFLDFLIGLFRFLIR